ncbi:MAG: cytochrome c oxidase subunit [Solirubrobacteraceae bacterium]|jgi:cytochrome c oxidase subunit 2|nr:cytochrome c oxidase subunit [Solirubrobacteraceae bacterium]
MPGRMGKERGRQERTPVGWMVVHGAIASAFGIAAGLAIDWFPQQASTQSSAIDHLYDVLIWVSVPIFVTVMIIVLFSVQNFRMRPGEENLDGPPIHGNTRLEIIWTAIPAIILVVLCSYAWIVLNDIEEAKAGEMRINVTGQQFAWSYEYPQPGGKPIKSNVLYLIKDQPVRFNVKALDVIHDFWVPAFRLKIDAVPGITTRYRVTPDRLGSYPVVCAELCGLGHSVMRSRANVVTRADFNKWIAGKKAPAAAAGGGAVDAKKLFTDGNGTATACGGCHTLADAGTNGTTGPNLDKVVPGMSSAEIKQSIVQPDAKIAPGFQAGIMPKDYGDTLSPQELDALVKYLGEAAGK